MKRHGPPQVLFVSFAQICDHDTVGRSMWDLDLPFSLWKLDFKQFSLDLLFKYHGQRTAEEKLILIFTCSDVTIRGVWVEKLAFRVQRACLLSHTTSRSFRCNTSLWDLVHPHWYKCTSSSDRMLKNMALLEAMPEKRSFLTGLCSCWNFITFHLSLSHVLQMRSWWEKHAAGSWQSFKWVKLEAFRS